MDKDIKKIMNDATELKDRLEILVSETGKYKATREELGAINLDIRELLNEIKTAIETFKEFNDTKNILVQNYNSNTKKILEKVDLLDTSINKTIEEYKIMYEQQKEGLGKILEYNNNLEAQFSENKDNQIKHRKYFYIGMGLSILLSIIIIIITIVN